MRRTFEWKGGGRDEGLNGKSAQSLLHTIRTKDNTHLRKGSSRICAQKPNIHGCAKQRHKIEPRR